MRTRTLLPVVATAAIALTATGCGDDKKSDTTADGGATTTTKTVGATAQVQVTTTPEGAVVATAERAKPAISKYTGPAPTDKVIVKDLVEGTGPAAKTGDALTVHYIGALAKNGTVFDTNWKEGGQPFALQLGAGQVIKGWDEGLVGMKVGGRREIVIPADLAYGKTGSPPTIPANSDLVFVVDLDSIG
jgi:peptidylprolyl isomerase